MHKIGKSRFVLIALLLLALSPEVARTQRPNFKIFTTEHGLAHDSINRIVRDSRGFLWFCTSEGLSRFDGRHFKNFTQDQGLPHRNVTDFLETRDGTILIGTSYGLVLFDPDGRPYRWNIVESKLEKDGDEPAMFETFVPPDSGSRLHRQVQSLAQDINGVIWVGMGAGLYRITKAANHLEFEEFKVQEKVTNFAHIVADSRGGIVTTSGYHLYRILGGQVQKVADVTGFDVMQDKEGRIWVGSGGEQLGVRIFEFNAEGRLVQTRSYTKRDGLVADTHFRALYETSSGRIFVGGDLNGLSEFLPEAKPGEPKFRSLSGEYVSALSEDAAGNLWVGTELKGAWELASGGFEIFGADEGIPDTTNISSILTTTDGSLFLTVWPDGVMEYAPSGRFELVKPAGPIRRSWGWNYLDQRSDDGTWWTPSSDGLYRYPPVLKFSSLSTTRPLQVYTKSDGLWSNEVFNIFKDSGGDIWIALINGSANTLARWNHLTSTITSYDAERDGLARDNLPISFAEDRQGDIWIGYYFGDLTRFRDGKFRTFSVRDGLPSSQVDDLHVDADGRLWIATTGRGVFRINDTAANDPVFESISTQNGLSSNQAICFAEDKFRQMYIGTGHGINRIDPNGKIRVFTQADGLPSNYITRCAADSQGYLWFVSRTTLVRFKATIDTPSQLPPSFIDKISVGGVPQKISVLGQTDVDLADLDSDQHQIQIDYFALTSGEGENVRYQYRLDDNDWSQTSEQQSVSLELGSGEHAFTVRAVRSDGAISPHVATARMTIAPAIWARWWFIAGSTFVGALLLFALYEVRTRHLREVNAALTDAAIAEERLRKAGEDRLAELERVRSRIATDLHDDIGSSLTQIAVLSEVARAKSDGNGAAEPLTKISDVSNELVESMSDIVWAITPSKDHFGDLSQRMLRFAADVFSPLDIEFTFIAPAKVSDMAVSSNLRREMFLIYKELVNNIVKHSEAQKISISLESEADRLVLEINDDGKGFDSSELDPRETTDSQFTMISPGSMGGNGLRNMYRRAREMGGELAIDSHIGSGTRTLLVLPLEAPTRAGREDEEEIR